MSDTTPVIDVGEINPKTGRPKLSWDWDTEIWAPCRLGEAFTLREFDRESTQYLYSIKASWMGEHGDGASVWNKSQLEGEYQHPIRVGISPRPWGCCWTYEPKIKITPPVWCWKFQDDTMFGLELKPKRNGNRRKAKLDCVMIHKGRPVYCIVAETSDGESRRYYDSIPVLDPYFAPIWPTTAEETPEVAEPAPEPVADPVAETVTNAPEPERTGPEAERTPENTEQTTDSENSTTVAILPSANWPGNTYYPDMLDGAVYANHTPDTRAGAVFSAGGVIGVAGPPEKITPPELIVPTDQLRRVLTTSNATNLVAAYMAQEDEDAPASWTGTENRPPGACIGGRTPFSGKYYYYVWFEEPPTEGETYEQKAGP